MFSFFASAPAKFSYQADFSRFPYANISFFDREKTKILFHLSLRSDQGLAACNKRGSEPDSWSREARKSVAFDGKSMRVEIQFDAPRVSVLLDGKRVFSFGGALFPTRYPNLQDIAFVDFQGGVVAPSIDVEVAADAGAPKQKFELNRRLELRGRLPAASATKKIHLDIPGLDLPPSPVIAVNNSKQTTFRCMLPGRAWRSVGPEDPLVVRLMVDGQSETELRITRKALADKINRVLETSDPGGDPLICAQLIEHVRFGNLLPALSPKAADRIAAIAAQYRLEPFLFAEVQSPNAKATPDPISSVDEEERSFVKALGHAAETLEQASEPSDWQTYLSDLVAPKGREVFFYAALAEPFCRLDAFEDLYVHVKGQDFWPFEMPNDPWTLSGLLPFFLLSGDEANLKTAMWALPEATSAWVMHEPMAWTIKNAVRSVEIHEHNKESLIYAFLEFIDRRRQDYWQRTACQALIEAVCACLRSRDHFTQFLANDLETATLRAFSLIPDFWTALGDVDGAVSPRLAVAKKAFDAVAETGNDDHTVLRSLSILNNLGCTDVTRVRREFAAAGLTSSHALSDLLADGADPLDAALRAAADPLGNPSENILNKVRVSLPELYPDVPRSPFEQLRIDACHRAQQLIETAQSGEDPISGATELLSVLSILSSERSNYVGLCIAASLAAGFETAYAHQSYDVMRDFLAAKLRKSGEVPHSTAVQMGLMTLKSHCGAASIKTLISDFEASAETSAPILFDQPCNPLFDTLVVIYSCQPNLATRIPAIMATWATKLTEMGIPFLVAVGNGDGSCDGGVIYLDAPDDYEGLPQKTLALVKWVHDHTRYAHVVKVDDDCFLNAEAFFAALNHRTFDYYGRTLYRHTGQLDRSWHNAKSTSQRGLFELDKSPEPSDYCDGGSGYALSRTAMSAVLDASSSPEGQLLMQVSFMEDKLLGDLLALRGIRPQNEDYRITIRRRESRRGIPVARWLNSFDASQSVPVKLVHLDASEALATAQDRLDAPGLNPKKIWPTFVPATLGAGTNALEMVSGVDRLGAAREAAVSVVACVRNEMFMLPHFLSHYRRLGVESFLIADNCSDDGSLEFLADQPDVALFSVDTAYSHSQYGVAWQQALLAHYRIGQWSLVADADELLFWETTQNASLVNLVQSETMASATAARVFMLDMYPKGSLSESTFDSMDPFAETGFVDRSPFLRTSFGRGPYSNAPTWTSSVRHRLIPGSRNELFVAQKIALLKYSPLHRLSAGLHYVSGVELAEREFFFGHFKYNAAFRKKALEEVGRKQHFNDAEEYRKYLAMASEGRDVVFDQHVSVHWTECPFVTSRLT